MKLSSFNPRFPALLGVVVLASVGLALPAWGQETCAVCGAALTDNAAAVTDWETNREFRYHDLSCAARDMMTRFPWSRAAVNSPASGQRITLTRINGSWRAQPEGAVVALLSTGQTGCGDAVAFTSLAEFRQYQGKRQGGIPASARPVELEALPGQLLTVGASQAQPPTPAASASVAGAEAVSAQSPPQTESAASAGQQAPAPGAPAAPAFSDIPPGHWAANYVETAKALGLMQGYPDGTFRGGQPVTRYELAAIVARLVEKGAAAGLPSSAAPVSAPQQPQGPPTSAVPPATTPTVPSAPAQARAGAGARATPAGGEKAEASLLGLSGLMTAPDAKVRQAGGIGAVAGTLNEEFVGAASAGIGSGVEVAVTSARLRDEDRLFLSAKKRVASLSRDRTEVAAGVTGLGTDTSAFAAATKELKLAGNPVDLTLGLGTGGLLDGPFAGASARLGKLVPFAKSAQLLAESVDGGDGRHFNYGLDLAVRPDLDLKFGSVDGHVAAGLLLGRRF